jgi:hypothetical protein
MASLRRTCAHEYRDDMRERVLKSVADCED